MTWLPFNLASGPLAPPDPPNSIKDHFSRLKDQLGPIPAALAIFAAGGLASTSSILFYRRYFRRIRNSDWVLPHHISQKRWIKGVVTSVGDNDNFRLYHTPGFGWRYPFKFRPVPNNRKDLRDETVHVRIAGIDAPENAHFGRETQPFAAEAHEWLKSEIEGNRLYCQLRRKDQYGRIVCFVQKPPRFLPGTLFNGESLALKMLRAGWATTYQQAGAEYGPLSKDEYLRVEATARSAKRGMWKNGVGELPAEYKARHRALGKGATKTARIPESTLSKLGLLSRTQRK